LGRIIAVDYGRKRTGIAVTDELRMIANPLTTVSSHNLVAFLKEYIRKENVDMLVVGEPRKMNNQASESFIYIEAFIKHFKRVMPDIPVERMDERFTSKIAFQAMVDAGLKKKDRQRKELVDTTSAVLILQSFLEKQDSMKRNN